MSVLSNAPARRLFDAPLIVTGALVLIVISLVIPMPPAVLDIGIAISIASAMLVLVMASLVDKPTDFQAFPVLLLISLVIRLSLNVSSTRLILSEGHNGKEAAGQVINGFADFVAGGSLLVGLTVFAVISIVNFMVITKGSTRMAEVAARFALDSLPGKQLAIDGDLGSGAIDHDEARRRRVQEQTEISFYGSLDGASKFVKGDAIAGIIITFINLLVGLAVGIFAHGMAISEAVTTYSHLTIGDGLVTQVPALITSMAAALLLSRGGATDPTATLLSAQFAFSWKPSAAVAASMLLMATIPGMPTLLFLCFAGGAGTLAWYLARRAAKDDVQGAKPENEPAAQPPSRIGDILDTDEISVELGIDLVAIALDQSRGLGPRINNLRIHVARSYGLILPDVRITDAEELSPGDYQIRVQGVIRGRGTLRAHEVLALGSPALLTGIAGQDVREPVYSSPARWIARSDQDDASILGATVVAPMEVLSTHLLEVVKAHLPTLLTLSAMQRQIDELKTLSDSQRAERYRKYFDGMIPDKVSPDTLLAISRALLEERLSIRNLTLITDAICEYRSIDSAEVLYEMVRKRLRGQITQQYSNDKGAVTAIQLHPAWEAEFIRTESESGRGANGMIAPTLAKRLIEACRKALAEAPIDVVLTAPDHRRRMVRAALVSNGVTTPVLGLDEIDASAELHFVGVVEVS